MLSFISSVLMWIACVEGYQPFMDAEIDFASSPEHFAEFISIESQVIVELFDDLKLAQKDDCKEKIRWYTNDFEETLLRDVELDGSHFVNLIKRSTIDGKGFGYYSAKNACKVFRSLKRFVKSFPSVRDCVTREGGKDKLDKILKGKILPKESDVENAVLSLLKINQIYKIPFTEFVHGKFRSMKTNCHLTSEHLMDIGDTAATNKLYSQAVDAYSIAAWSIMTEEQRDKSANVSETLEKLDQAIKTHDKKLQGSLELEDIHPDSGPLYFHDLLYNVTHPNFKSRKYVGYDTLTLFANHTKKNVPPVLTYSYQFERLCRGEEVRTPSEISPLKCYLSSKTHPEFLLKPLKIEVHHMNPLVLQYHDVFTESEMAKYRNEVSDELRVSRTIRQVDNEMEHGVITRHRTSSNAWIMDAFSRKFQPYLYKIGRTVGLDTSRPVGSENIQIATYNPGGQYVPHTDAVFEEEILHKLDATEFIRGDRIATFMIYLSDVEEGGSTAFPYLKTAVRPTKGSAVMWYNLYPNGTIDRRTLHGGCSVLYGVKWIANKWIRNNEQFKLRKCPLSSQASSWPLDLHVDNPN